MKSSARQIKYIHVYIKIDIHYSWEEPLWEALLFAVPSQ